MRYMRVSTQGLMTIRFKDPLKFDEEGLMDKLNAGENGFKVLYLSGY